MAEILLIVLFVILIIGLLSGYPVALVLAGASLLTAFIGSGLGAFDLSYISAFPNRIWGIMTNDLLIAVPLFVFMGVMLEKARIAEELLETMAGLFGGLRAGLGISVILVGALMAASTGIVGATVVTMGLISLPVMLKTKYDAKIATGAICASGTLGQIIPPSIVLILLGDQISSAHQAAQMKIGNFSASPVSIADLFMGAIIPGFCLVALYIVWLLVYSFIKPENVPAMKKHKHYSTFQVAKVLFPPLILILVVLGSILAGIATATESAAVGAIGSMLLAFTHGKLSRDNMLATMRETTRVTSMVFTILIGAAMFTLVFRGLSGEDMVHDFLSDLPGGLFGAMLVTMLIMFLLGFFLDFIEIIFVVVPIVAPVLLLMGADPVWLAIMIAINLQTSFLTPPFGFALFYLRGVAPKSVKTLDIYKGVIPFVAIQIITLVILSLAPRMATYLPEKVYGSKHTNEIFDSDFQEETYTVDF